MLSILPVILLCLASFAILLIQRVRKGLGYVWLFSVLITIIVLGIEIFLRWRLPLDFWVQNWMRMGAGVSLIGFRLDPAAWAYGLSLSAMCLAVILTAPARLQEKESVGEWSACLALTGLGILSALASTPLGLIYIWTGIDIFELGVLLATSRREEGVSRVVTAFFSRLAGTALVFTALLYSLSKGQVLIWNQASPEISLFLLIGCGFRLGILPVHLPLQETKANRRGLGTVLRSVSAVSSLAPISRLPEIAASPGWAQPLLWLTGAGVLYGAVMWMSENQEISGRPYWSISFAGMAVASSLQGVPSATVGWGVAMVLVGGMIFLYSSRVAWVSVVISLGLIGLSGLPFTPLANGWQGVARQGFSPLVLVFLIAQVFILVGYLKHLRRSENALIGAEGWIRAVYPVGFFVLLAAHWLIGILGWRGSFTVGIWWAGAADTLGFLVVAAMFGMLPGIRIGWKSEMGFALLLWKRIGGGLARAASLEWLYSIVRWVYALLGKVVGGITILLEGEGGILWVLLLLSLFLSLTRGGNP
ncbi:MAG TPA: hypothetical protein VIO61_16905 [Anaerolineaceae bacterium]